MDQQQYLKRINYHGPLTPNLQTLKQLTLQHLYHVPFENLSVIHKEPIILEIQKLYQKIVNRNRGGFCYELNGLFAHLLQSLGFEVHLISAGVFGSRGFGPEYDHLCLWVQLEQPWLVDVGFGRCFREPIQLNLPTPQQEIQGTWRFLENDGYLYLMEKTNGCWQHKYRFQWKAREFSEFEARCRYHQSSPNSHFTQKTTCSRALEDGRVTLSASSLIHSDLAGERSEKTIENQEQWNLALLENFAISLNP